MNSVRLLGKVDSQASILRYPGCKMPCVKVWYLCNIQFVILIAVVIIVMIIIIVEIAGDNIEMDFREMGCKLHSVGSG